MISRWSSKRSTATAMNLSANRVIKAGTLLSGFLGKNRGAPLSLWRCIHSERLESGEVATQLSSFLRVCRVLGLLERFDSLLPEPVMSPMAQLKMQGRRRQRAGRSKEASGELKKWTWGESL